VPAVRRERSGRRLALPKCRGETRVIEERTYNVDVPAGVDTGSTSGWRAAARPGRRRCPAGDLYVHVRVASSDRFQRDGYDLVVDLPISISQAALGTHVEIEAPDGAIDVPSPPARRVVREFRSRHRGIPFVDGRGRGDLRVVARVETPSKLSATEEELAAPPGRRAR
jgi:molecular chaperone DnaJ